MSHDTILHAIIEMLVGLGILMVGFKLLSENIQKIANTGLKKLFNRKSKNHLVEVGVGTIATAVMHSSAASTVMVVGFVNAGIMNLHQATAMIMGANIGTTVTAQVAALGGFDFSIFATLLAVIGVFINLIFKKDKIKALGIALSGLGLVFTGLKLMPDALKNPDLSNAIENVIGTIENPFLLLLIGGCITALIQSSTAVTTIIISMVAAGITIGKGGNSVLYVILGTNIGTCITALLSSAGANANAKRASLIHLMFNILGALLFFVVFICWPNFMDNTLSVWFASKPATQIAMFHTLFNVTCTLLFLPFISLFVKVATLCIKDEKKVSATTFIDERFLKSPSIALAQAAKETMRLGKLSMETLSLSIKSFITLDISNTDEINANITNIEAMNEELLTYLVKVSALNPGDESENQISKLHKILNDFYREVEIADNMKKYTITANQNNLAFSATVKKQISVLNDKLNQQFENVTKLNENISMDLVKEIESIEEEIDNMRYDMINAHIERLERQECSPASSGVFINLVSNLERAGDHLNYIAQTIVQE